MIEKMAKRTVRVTKEQSQEVMKLATLMGLPVFEAPCEAAGPGTARCCPPRQQR
jgi:flap endonuclease-1